MQNARERTRKSRRARRGQNVLIWMVGLFLVGQLMGGILLERLWPEYRFPIFYRQLARLAAESKPPNVIFFGSSRFGLGVSAENITDWTRTITGDEDVQAFNAAVPAGDPVACERMLNHVLALGIKPRVVVIEICPDVVADRNGWMQFHLRRQMCWEDVPTYFSEIARTGCLARLLSNRLVPLYQQRNAICQELERKLEERLDAWLCRPRRADDAELSNEQKFDWQAVMPTSAATLPEECVRNTQGGVQGFRRIFVKYNAGGAAGAALERMLETCQANGVTAILVGVPLTKAHRDLYTPEVEEKYQAYLREILSKFDCRYVECRHRLADSLFFDNHHANIDGCRTFSRLLTEEILAPWWIAQGPPEKETRE